MRSILALTIASMLGALLLTGCPDKDDKGAAKADPAKAPTAASAAPAAPAGNGAGEKKGGW